MPTCTYFIERVPCYSCNFWCHHGHGCALPPHPCLPCLAYEATSKVPTPAASHRPQKAVTNNAHCTCTTTTIVYQAVCGNEHSTGNLHNANTKYLQHTLQFSLRQSTRRVGLSLAHCSSYQLFLDSPCHAPRLVIEKGC